MIETFFKTPAFIPALAHIFHKNWEYIYLNNLIYSQVSLTVMRSHRIKLMTSQTLEKWYLLISFMFRKSLLFHTAWKALRQRGFVLGRKGKGLLLRSWTEKKLTNMTTDSGSNVCVTLEPVKQDESVERHKHELWQRDGVSLHNSSRRTLPQMFFIGYERSYCHCAFNNELQ